jgi:hypothetical protein
MKTHVKSAFVAVAMCGLFACVEPVNVETSAPETVGQQEQASSGSCWACFTEWSYCDDNCTWECQGVPEWSECFHQCQERCSSIYYQCLSSCEI